MYSLVIIRNPVMSLLLNENTGLTCNSFSSFFLDQSTGNAVYALVDTINSFSSFDAYFLVRSTDQSGPSGGFADNIFSDTPHIGLNGSDVKK